MSINSSRLLNNITNLNSNEKNQNQTLIIILIGVTILSAILFFFSKTFRVNRVVNNMNIYTKYQNLESMKTNLIKKYRLGDFYISSSINSAHSGYQIFDYVSSEMVKKTLQSGARYLEFQIFADHYGPDAIPIVSSGFEKGEWKLTLNQLTFEEVIKTLRQHAFRVYDGTDGSPNYLDPLFIGLNLKTNRNYVLHNKIQKILIKYFLDYLLDPSYNYQARNLAQVPLADLMGKVIIFSSDGFQGSYLEEIVNYSWSYAKMKRVLASDLISEHASNISSEDDSVAAKVLANKYQKGDITADQYHDELEKTKSVIETHQLKKFNFNNLTIVYPQKDGEFFTSNQDPTTAWKLGCQFVGMNFQSIDREMDKYITQFRRHSFVLKPKHLRV